METMNDFLVRIIAFVLFVALALKGCSNETKTSETCKQESLEVWTNEFITRMNSGSLPDDANQMAELVSVKALAQCMDQQKKN
jgi:PBP1b-binding outer membrane lipoprotein LpoB